jgi:hypothetical protein
MRQKEINDVKDVDNYYNQVRKIKFNDGIEINNILDIKLLLYPLNAYTSKTPTYFGKNGNLHTGTEKYRSFNDYFILCKYYFPDKHVSEFAKVLRDDEVLKKKNEDYVMAVRYCPNIKRHNSGGSYVRYSYGAFYDASFVRNKKLEFGFGNKFTLHEIINSKK